jgi:uncharacterized protein YjbI with pentapeptide repeats
VVRPYPPDLPPQPEDPDLTASRIAEARLAGISLAGERRPGLALLDCFVHDCDLANLDAHGARMRRVEIVGGRLTGCSLSEATLTDVSLTNCRADLVAFAMGSLERVLFTSCNLSQADFQQGRLRHVVFEDCDLEGADLSNTRFEAVEMRGCRLAGVRGAGNLRGVGMPWSDIVENAELFASACGVAVLDQP